MYCGYSGGSAGKTVRVRARIGRVRHWRLPAECRVTTSPAPPACGPFALAVIAESMTGVPSGLSQSSVCCVGPTKAASRMIGVSR
jgi:hypothetical protein